MKKAFIIGVTGQDGAYLARFLLDKGYEVHGLRRSSSTGNTSRLDYLLSGHAHRHNFYLHYGDVSDQGCLSKYLGKIQPDEVYNLAAQSHVHVSFQNPEYTGVTDGISVLKILEALRAFSPAAKFYQASTSELYGMIQHPIQNENTPFYPRSPYAVAKLYAYWICRNYREAYNIFAANGILFNHESPLRGSQFVTRKITRAIARICVGLQRSVAMGNLNAMRDWGHAADYVEAMWRILQHDVPDDFVIATGQTTSVRAFIEKSAKKVGIQIVWTGAGVDEIGLVDSIDDTVFMSAAGSKPTIKVGDVLVSVDPYYYRPTEVDILHGDPSKAKKMLGWEPRRGVDQLIDEMIAFDLLVAKTEKSAGIACHLDTV